MLHLVPLATIIQTGACGLVVSLRKEAQSASQSRSAEGTVRQLVPGGLGRDIFAVDSFLTCQQSVLVPRPGLIPHLHTTQRVNETARRHLRCIGRVRAAHPKANLERAPPNLFGS